MGRQRGSGKEIAIPRAMVTAMAMEVTKKAMPCIPFADKKFVTHT
jgi:hypothetical protein